MQPLRVNPAQEGHKVIVTARRKERLLALQQEIGENCLPLALDITDEKATLQAQRELPEAWKAIDIFGQQCRFGVRYRCSTRFFL